MNEADGFLLIDKPLGWTSHDVVAKARGITRIRKIGHAGTLDPLATGLLVLGIGRATKQLAQVSGQTKAYEAEVTFGAASDTDDAEGTLTSYKDFKKPSVLDIREAVHEFKGDSMQIPPAYAAIKHQGRKLYELARAGEVVPREARPVVIHEVKVEAYEWPHLKLSCVVSKGTYIRSLARDIGEKLGCGGYLSALRRTAIGDFCVSDAISPQQLQEDWRPHLLSSVQVGQNVAK